MLNRSVDASASINVGHGGSTGTPLATDSMASIRRAAVESALPTTGCPCKGTNGGTENLFIWHAYEMVRLCVCRTASVRARGLAPASSSHWNSSRWPFRLQ